MTSAHPDPASDAYASGVMNPTLFEIEPAKITELETSQPLHQKEREGEKAGEKSKSVYMSIFPYVGRRPLLRQQQQKHLCVIDRIVAVTWSKKNTKKIKPERVSHFRHCAR